MMHAINKKNISSEQASQTTFESLPPNKCKIKSCPQRNWNPQIQTTSQPQEIILDKKSSDLSHVEQNVVRLNQEFSDL